MNRYGTPRGLFGREALRHRFVTMDHHRQQAALTLEPDLVEIVLDLAANAQIVDQNMGIGRHRLLMQTDMTIRIYVRDGEHMVALRQQLAGQRRGTVRQVSRIHW